MTGHGEEPTEHTVTVLVYSDDSITRRTVRQALGRRPAKDIPRVEWIECATEPAVIALLDKGGIDLAIRGGTVAEASLVARRVGASARHVVASAEYLDRNGAPVHPSDLTRHSCIVFMQNATPNEWRFQGPGGAITVEVGGRFRTDSSEAMRAAVVGGVGLALVGQVARRHGGEVLVGRSDLGGASFAVVLR